MDTVAAEYPVTLEIDYPDRPLDRFTSFFRPIMALPIVILLLLVSGATARGGENKHVIGAGGIIFLATVCMLVVREKYPRWWFDWNVALTRFGTRVCAYLALLDDRYPSTDADQGVHIVIPYPDPPSELDRWLPLVKWLLAIPHYVVLALLTAAAIIGVLVAWFAILFTGRYPRGIFEFVVGVLRWWLRVSAYAFLLVTDRYPPFQLT